MLRFVITFDPKYGYSWKLVDNRGHKVARPGGYDFAWHKETVMEDIIRMKAHVFVASIEDNTPAKAPG